MGCIMKCGFKLALIIMSVIFSLAGVFLIFFGLISLVNQSMLLNILGADQSVIDYLEAPQNQLFSTNLSTGISIAILGLIMIGLGFIGWIGACCGCRLCLLGYAVAMIVVLALEIALIVVIALQPSRIQDQAISSMNENLEYYDGQGLQYNTQTGDLEEPKESKDNMLYEWDYLQIQGQCCGSDNYTSWQKATNWTRTYQVCTGPNTCTTVEAIVPLSCCKVNDPNYFPSDVNQMAITNATECLAYANPQYTNQAGCYGAIEGSITSFSDTIIIIAAISIGIEIFNIVAACYVFKHTGLLM